ncbi:hypothetical protein MPSEU_000674200 [Mayamaea pseudoterrestris]|nr:hypothetical protein MPSEU_000674200 [Mayamaea pseudoterrestris]
MQSKFPRPNDGEKDEKIRLQQSQRSKLLWLSMLILLFILCAAMYLASSPNVKQALNVQRVKMTTETAAKLRNIVSHVANEERQVKEKQQQPKAIDPVVTFSSLLEAEYGKLDAETRRIKATGVIMEKDPASQRVISQLQDLARKLIVAKYGQRSAYRVRLDVEFQPSIPDFVANGKDGSLIIEMAPIHLIPVSVYTFLEVARTYKSGSFHRNADHVLQAEVHSGVTKSLPFQEYSPEFPHTKGTTGYCGRPSGPCFYVSIQDNIRNHGPGSQQKHNPYEADANFGRVVQGMDDVVPRIHTVPQKEWLDEKNKVYIRNMHILVPKNNDNLDEGFVEWKQEL